MQKVSREYITQYLSHLGLEVNQKNIEIAKWALQAPVPIGWNEGVSDQGEQYFWRENKNKQREIRWEHPIDNVLKQWALNESEKPDLDEQKRAIKAYYDKQLQSEKEKLKNEIGPLEINKEKNLILKQFQKEKLSLKKQFWNEFDKQFQNENQQVRSQIDEQFLNEQQRKLNDLSKSLNEDLYQLELEKNSVLEEIRNLSKLSIPTLMKEYSIVKDLDDEIETLDHQIINRKLTYDEIKIQQLKIQNFHAPKEINSDQIFIQFIQEVKELKYYKIIFSYFKQFRQFKQRVQQKMTLIAFNQNKKLIIAFQVNFKLILNIIIRYFTQKIRFPKQYQFNLK